ncbi:hypothetical protein B0H14DRAFT_2622102 [Mycena olivaceomarginata]|nr:hypothetical protein B0H14DRAFT_2622102 [Mycena olivaceomarginata]
MTDPDFLVEAADTFATPVAIAATPLADKSVNQSTTNEAEVKGNHTKLRHLIKTQKKALNKKEVLISNTKAASTLLNLEALSQYNDKLLELALKKIKLKTNLRTASRLLRPKLKQRLANSHPVEEASLAISHRCGRGPYFARVLREMAAQLLSDGTMPEKHQGVGAHHESLLDNPAIREALQEWVKGTLEVEQGGFIGRVNSAFNVWSILGVSQPKKFPDRFAHCTNVAVTK